MTKETVSDIRNILQSKWFVAFFLMIVSFFYDVVLFKENGAFFNTFLYSVILCLYYAGWVVSLSFGKIFTCLVLIFNFLIFCVLKEYYKFHTIPLKLPVVLSMWQDGVSAGWKNKAYFFDGMFFVCFTLLLIQIYFVLKKSFFSIKKMCFFSVVIIFSLFFFLNYLLKPVEGIMQLENPKLFLSYQQGMVYKLTIFKDIVFKKDKNINFLILNGNKKIREEAKNDDIFLPFLPQHIFLIQAESLTTKALKNMPFLKDMKKNAYFYVDKNHNHCIGSGNTDFMMMSGLNLECEEASLMIYYAYPETIYDKIKPLSEVFQEKGYKTFFLHGYHGEMYQRKKHYSAMSFNHVLFLENFNQKLKKGSWGLGDYTFFDVISKNLISEKSFYFIITSGMHPPYDVFDLPNENQKKIPDNQMAKYLNAAYSLDLGIKKLYLNAPNDSLFIIYGDHNVPELKAYDTPFIMLYKGDNQFKISIEKQDGFKETIHFVNSLFE